MAGDPATVSTLAYRAFISYSHQDKSWADWLHKALETYRVPSRLVGGETAAGIIPRRLGSIFRDRDELASATDLGRKVNEALLRSANLIVVCSPHSAASHWVEEEVLAFKRLGRAERIFCLIVDGEPAASDLPGRESEECFARALRFTIDANGQPTNTRTEPIAADARPGKDGKTNAKLKLIAGLLDVGFNALKQREQQRRNRRMAAVTAFALIVMAVTSALAISAVIARRAADLARQAAERRQKQAEDLVDFMLGDLSTKLRQVDRLDILGSIDDKAMAYFKSLPISDVNATALAQRAKALQKIGDVRINQSRLSDAMDAFQQALTLNKRLVGMSPDDAARQNAYGENLLWIGFDDWYQGNLDRAEDSFKQAASALQHAAALAPADNDVQHNLDSVLSNLGHVMEARGELDFAYRDYVTDLELCQRMANAHRDDMNWQNALGDAYNNLGSISLTRGHLDEAVAAYLEDQQHMTEAVARDPKNRRMQDQLLISEAILGRTLALAGQTQAGLDQVKAALKIGQGLVAFDPSHTDWQDNYNYYTLLQGRLLLEQGGVEASRKPIETAVTALQKLVDKDPGNAEWRANLAEAQLESARLALARKHADAATQLAMQSDATMHKLLAGKSPKAASIRIEADIELLTARLAADSGDMNTAANARKQALARIQPLATHSSDPRTLSLWVDGLLATGDEAKAQPAIHALQQMGYRPAGFVARLRSHGIDYPENPGATQRIAHAMQSMNVSAVAATAGRP